MVHPTQRLVFLGIMPDTVECAMLSPAEKLETLHEFLVEFSVCCRAFKRQLQVLAGKLNWACQVVYGGRTFLRRVIDQICLLKSPNAKFRLNSEFFADLRWCISFLSSFNGRQVFLDEEPTIDVQAVACSIGAGAFCSDWLYHSFILDAPEVSMLHINYKEVLAIYFAAKQWATSWSGHHIVIHSDNRAAVAIINKGTCRNKVVMAFLRDLFWLSAVCNFRITAKYIPGHLNIIVDAISRLHDEFYLNRFCQLLSPWYYGNMHGVLAMSLLQHMPYLSFMFLFFRYFGPFFKRGTS